MPGRIATGAREVVSAALAEARLRGDRRIGTEHLFLGVLSHPETAAARSLAVGLPAARGALAALDREALAALGIAVAAPADDAEADDAGAQAVQPDRWAAQPPAGCTHPAAGRAGGVLFGGGRQRPTPAQVVALRSSLSSGARAVLAGAVVAAPSTPSRRVTPEQLLLALLDRQPPDPAAALLDHLGVDRAVTRARLGGPPP